MTRQVHVVDARADDRLHSMRAGCWCGPRVEDTAPGEEQVTHRAGQSQDGPQSGPVPSQGGTRFRTPHLPAEDQ